MAKEIIAPKNVWDSREENYFSQAIKAGNTIYISGQCSVDEKRNLVGRGDFEVQMRQSLENIRRLVGAAGGSMSDVVKLMFFLRDIRDFIVPEVGRVLPDYFGDSFPTSTAIQISNLWRPDFMLSIEGTLWS